MRTISELFNLSERNALITGGSGHLGSTIGLALAECGAKVALLDKVDTGLVDKKFSNIKKENYQKIKMGLSDKKELSRISEVVKDSLGSLDILINCAAMVGTDELKGWVDPVESQSEEVWRDALEINLTVPFVITKNLISILNESSSPSVINIGSIYGILGPDWSLYSSADIKGTPAAYAASKGGLMQLTRWLATSLAPAIRVNAIVPGGVERNTPVRFKKEYEKKTPLRRLAKEEDLKGVSVFLASDASSYITGQCIMVDGGWSVW